MDDINQFMTSFGMFVAALSIALAIFGFLANSLFQIVMFKIMGFPLIKSVRMALSKRSNSASS